MNLAAGFRLGPYEITAKLGEGGMGEVYRATDSKLRRDVAIKVLPAAFTADPERLARFEREAQLLAQLHHPNIASVFGLEESDGVRALVMELVDGEDLSARLARGAVPLDEALPIARQITEALEAAHEKGIVHRDLKPANVKLRPDGAVKVLDFGLAKALDPAAGAAAAADPARSPTLMNSPTVTSAALAGGTQLGVILGTAAYMAPEQARGGMVDKRADIWSFGVVLHEMLTGRSAFLADTVPDTLAAVLTREVDNSKLPASTPVALRDLLRRCLERKPKNRLHDIADARIVLDDLLAGRMAAGEGAAGSPAVEALGPRGNAWPQRLLWLGAGVAVGALAFAGLGRTLFQAPPQPPPTVRSLTYSGTSRNPSMSPDGRFVAFISNRDGTSRVWLKQLATGEEVALTSGNDIAALLSPDSSTVLIARRETDKTDLYSVPLVGGEPRRLVADTSAADWSPDGRQLVVARDRDGRSQLLLVPSDGGEERLLVEQEARVLDLAWSPDGSRILVRSASRVNSISQQELATVDVEGGERREVYRIQAGTLSSNPIWDGADALLFAWSPSQAGRGEALLQRLTLGDTQPRALISFASLPQQIALAGPGALLYDAGSRHLNLFDADASTALGRALTGGPTLDRQPSFSPDGTRVVFTSDRSGNLDLWSLELATGAVRRLTFDAADDWDPHWSADGKRLLWSSNRGGHFEVWTADPDGTGARQLTSDGADAENPTTSADGAWVVYSSSNPAGPGIWKIRSDGQGAERVLAGSYILPELSPKEGWIAATRSDSLDGTERSIVIVGLGGEPVAEVVFACRRPNPGRSRWLPDGRTLVFYGDDASGRAVLFQQPIVPGKDTSGERRVVAVSSERSVIESFGVSPVDGRIVAAAGWAETDVLLGEGIPGIGASLKKRGN
jgi:Tol biopolymer transport system component